MIDSGGYCKACGEVIPAPDRGSHAAGADSSRLACPAQSIDAVRAAQPSAWTRYLRTGEA